MKSALSSLCLLLMLCASTTWADATRLPLRPAYDAEQRAWLKAHPVLRVGLIQQAPWVQRVQNRQLVGANIDLMKRLLEGMGVTPDWHLYPDLPALERAAAAGEVDLAPGLQQTPAGLRIWHYSMPYLRVPHLVVGERSGSGSVDLDQLPLEQIVAVRVPSQAAEYLERTHTNLRLKPTSSERAALLQVLNQEVSYAVLDEASLSLQLRESRFTNLSIVGDIGLPQLLRLATRRDQPLLSDIVDRTLQALPARELEELRDTWLPLRYPQSTDFVGFWKTLTLFLFLLLTLVATALYRQRQQTRLLERGLLGARAQLDSHQQAAEALRLSQFSIDNSTVGILWVNWDSHLRYANGAAERMLGYRPGELVDRPLSQVEPSLDMDRWLRLWKRVREQEDGSSSFEIDCLRADGSRMPADVSLSFLRYRQAEYLVVFLSDVTERRRARAALEESEARFKGIAGNVPGLVFRLERAAPGQVVNFAYISEASQEMVGWPARELQREERGIRSLVHPQDLASYLNSQTLALEGESDWYWQGRILTRDDEVLWADIRTTARPLGGGRMVWDGILWDITENKLAELALADSRARLRELSAHLESVREEEKARIAREVHDELGQVLTVLKLETAMCELACAGQIPALDERLASMKRLIAQLFQLVRDVATALRPPILDAGIASAIEWQVRRFEERTQIPCLVEVPEHLMQLPDAQAIGLFRILQEALTNVMRHAGAHSVEVHLWQEDDSLCLSVADDGKGFDPAQRKPGQSFGLVGMQERMLMLGGQLQIDSRPGEGTTLYARITLDEEVTA
ncbi:PAS domain S-box protein [Pseudomonas sp. BMW13]|uniref:PAS domain-containing sensor histidine kinase n=1 Tax=Pseudomonadaceae TaxID=135621 RepID=UPI00158216ED|nr:sensor histidine kinase [Pseudomonas sp. BMW13]HIQ42927.1 PAS domain S-box protein [Pseudomonas oleovorans]